MKSALANKGAKDRGSRSRSTGAGLSLRPKSAGPKHRATFDPPKFAASSGDSRLDAFEAKFEKYRTNKRTKEMIEKRSSSMIKPDFDITTKNTKSPSKKTRHYTTVIGAEIDFKPSGKFDKDSLMPDGYDQALMREALLDTRKDPFRVLGVSPDDKMTFFLLKWVFDSIKEDSDMNDMALEGRSFVTKRDLVSQLSKNPELMQSLQITSKRELNDQVEAAACAKQGCLTWEEFLNYFFLRNATMEDRIDGNDWWSNLDGDGKLK